MNIKKSKLNKIEIDEYRKMMKKTLFSIKKEDHWNLVNSMLENIGLKTSKSITDKYYRKGQIRLGKSYSAKAKSTSVYHLTRLKQTPCSSIIK